MSNLAIKVALGSAVANSQDSDSSEQKTIYCNTVMPKFNPKIATIEQKQSYANCVDHFYPTMTGLDIIIMKVAIILAFIVFSISLYKGWKEYEIAMYFLVGVIGAFLVPVLFILASKAVMFLFS